MSFMGPYDSFFWSGLFQSKEIQFEMDFLLSAFSAFTLMFTSTIHHNLLDLFPFISFIEVFEAKQVLVWWVSVAYGSRIMTIVFET